MKIGILGTALSHPLTFSEALRELSIGEIVGIWSEEEHRGNGEKVGRKLDVPLLSTPEEVIDTADAVMVTTETRYHREYACRALARHKPVFVDKPLATCLEDARAIVGAAISAGTPMMSCSVRRFSPGFASVADEVRTGRAGKPVSAVRFEPHGIHAGGWQDRVDSSGGLIFNFGIHCVDTLQRVLGPVAEEVDCFADKLVHDAADSHDTAIIAIRFANRAVGTAEVIGCMTENEHMATAPHLRVFCTEKSMEAKLLEDQAMEYSGRRLGVSPYYHLLGGAHDTMRAFVRMVETGEPAIPYDEMLEVIRILEGARLSAAEKRRITLAEL